MDINKQANLNNCCNCKYFYNGKINRICKKNNTKEYIDKINFNCIYCIQKINKFYNQSKGREVTKMSMNRKQFLAGNPKARINASIFINHVIEPVLYSKIGRAIHTYK